MTSYRLSGQALQDLSEILAYIQREHGEGRALRFRNEVMRTVSNLAMHPHTGHGRLDLPRRAFRFWPVHSYLIVYRPETIPLEIVAFVHGARDPADLRDRIGEPVLGPAHYAAATNA